MTYDLATLKALREDLGAVCFEDFAVFLDGAIAALEGPPEAAPTKPEAAPTKPEVRAYWGASPYNYLVILRTSPAQDDIVGSFSNSPGATPNWTFFPPASHRFVSAPPGQGGAESLLHWAKESGLWDHVTHWPDAYDDIVQVTAGSDL